MKKLILILVMCFAAFAASAQCPPLNLVQNAKWKFIYSQCFQDTTTHAYVEASRVAYFDANKNLTYITYAQLGDSVGVSDSLANTKGWIFPFPDSFTFRPPFHVLQNPNTGDFLLDPSFNLRTYAAIEETGVAYYVNVETGSDANPGTSAGSPLKTIGAAIQKTDVATVYVASGYYYDRYSWRGLVPTRGVEIIGTGDSVILTSDFRDVLTFTLEGAHYKAYTDTVPGGLWDRLFTDQFGDAKTLALYTSKAQVDTATVGAYYYATDTIFLRLQDFRAPDSFVSVFTPGFNIRMAGEGLKYYFKNVYLYGGALYATNSTGGNGGVRVYADSVHTRGGSNTFDGTSEVILFNSSFAKVKNTDVINYDPQNGVVPTFVEYNCNVYNTMDLGYTPGGSDQASTAHNGCRGVRLNSTYKYTVGQCVADVNGCESWLVSCTADSAITTGSANYVFGTGADFGRAWLQDCESYNRPNGGYDVNSQALAVTHLNGFISDNYDFGTTGDIDSNYTFQLYDPIEYQMVHTMLQPHLLNVTTKGTNGQTIRYNGTTPVANSFLFNNGSAIGVGTTTPGYDLEVFGGAGGGDATMGIKTTISGVATIFALEGTGQDWFMGSQNTLNSGALIFTNSSLGSGSADMVLSTSGNLALSSTDVSTYKININGTARVATIPASASTSDNIVVQDAVTGQLEYIPQPLLGTATLDFPNTNANDQADLTITVTGAVAGDVVALGIPNASATTGSFTAWVSATNTVTVRFHNTGAGATDPASGSFKVKVLR